MNSPQCVLTPLPCVGQKREGHPVKRDSRTAGREVLCALGFAYGGGMVVVGGGPRRAWLGWHLSNANVLLFFLSSSSLPLPPTRDTQDSPVKNLGAEGRHLAVPLLGW